MTKKIALLLSFLMLCATPSLAYLTVGEGKELLKNNLQETEWKPDRTDRAVASASAIGPMLCLAGIINLSLGCCLSPATPTIGWGLFGAGMGITVPVYGGLCCHKCIKNGLITHSNNQVEYEIRRQQDTFTLPNERLESCGLRAIGPYILNADATIIKKIDIYQVLSLAPVDIGLFTSLVNQKVFHDEAQPLAEQLLEFLNMSEQDLIEKLNDNVTGIVFKTHPSFLASLIELLEPSMLENNKINSALRRHELDIFQKSSLPENGSEPDETSWLRRRIAKFGGY